MQFFLYYIKNSVRNNKIFMMKMEKIQSHAIEFNEVAKKLNTSIETGLSEEDVQERLKKYGKNELIKEKGKTAWQIFIGQFKDFLIYLLIFAIIISKSS